MFINKLNQVYKPQRVLFYTEAEEDPVADLNKGVIPEAVARCANAYGSYDQPGVFFIDALKQPVIGIEYRKDDESVEYPADLKSMIIEGAYYFSVELDHDIEISRKFVTELFEDIAKDDEQKKPDILS